MKKISLLLAFLCFIGLQVGLAQTRDISGTVNSAEDGNTIPGASVIVKGTTIGTITDMEGKFTLKAPSSATTLFISFVGMTSAEVRLTDNSNYNVKLSSQTVSYTHLRAHETR